MLFGSVNDNGVSNDSTLLIGHHMLTLVLIMRRNVHPQTTTLAIFLRRSLPGVDLGFA